MAAKKSVKKAPKAKASATAKDYSIILAPVVTEKSALLGNGGNTVVFKVSKTASKEEIKGAVERIFGKTVASVRTANYLGKPKRRMKAIGRTSSYKKATITLKAGETIEVVSAA
jgi:large subunit ribosomal protein L23